MIIQSLPALANVFVPSSAPVFTDIRMVELAPGVAQVQVKVVG
jgi:hypothetical protein